MSLPCRPPGDNTPAPPERERLDRAALSAAIDHAKRGRPVAPGCPPDEHGDCGCGGRYDRQLNQLVPHTAKEVGKAPIGKLVPHGISDATTNTATIGRWWRAQPDANVNVELQASRWVVVDTDSPQAEADALSRGLDGGAVRESRNRAYVFARPEGCPIVNLIRADGDPLDVLTLGNFVVWGTHQTGCPVRLDPAVKPGPAPEWVVDMLRAKAAAVTAQEATTVARREAWAATYGEHGEPPVRLHQRGMRRWTGELVAEPDGKLDRDLSLFYLGLDLAECGASHGTIVAALADRDAALGWHKFTGRKDDREYVKIAEKAVARAIKIEQERSGTTAPTTPASDANLVELRAAVEDRDATITRLQRGLLDRDDRLEVLEDVVHGIDDILSLPNEQMSASEKVVMIATARWLPFHVAKREAKGERPTVALGYVAKVAGTSKSTVSAVYKRFSSDDREDGAPFKRKVKRSAKFDGTGAPVIDPRTGQQAYESELILMPWGDRPAATMQAAVQFATARPRPSKHGGSQEAADARWGRCEQHDNREVRVKGYCTDCGKVVGEQTVPLESFERLNEQLAHSGGPENTVSGNSIGEQLAHSEPPLALFPDEQRPAQIRPPGVTDEQMCQEHGLPKLTSDRRGRCSMCKTPPTAPIAPQPRYKRQDAPPRPQERPERCPAPGCTALGFRELPDGSLRCLRSAHDPRAYEVLAAVAGGEE